MSEKPKIDINIRGEINTGKSTLAREIFDHLSNSLGVPVEVFDMDDVHDEKFVANQHKRMDWLRDNRGLSIRIAVEQVLRPTKLASMKLPPEEGFRLFLIKLQQEGRAR